MPPTQNIIPALSMSPVPYNKTMLNAYFDDCPTITNNAVKLRMDHNVLVRVHGRIAVYTCLNHYEYNYGDMLRWCLGNKWTGQEPSCKVNQLHSKILLAPLIMALVFLMAIPFFCVDFSLRVRRSTQSRIINDTRLTLKDRLHPQRVLPDDDGRHIKHTPKPEPDSYKVSNARAGAAVITLLDWLKEHPDLPGLTTIALRDVQHAINHAIME